MVPQIAVERSGPMWERIEQHVGESSTRAADWCGWSPRICGRGEVELLLHDAVLDLGQYTARH
jgi:hypothetical protein